MHLVWQAQWEGYAARVQAALQAQENVHTVHVFKDAVGSMHVFVGNSWCISTYLGFITSVWTLPL